VEGHTDSTGSETYNQKLSERRASSVKNLLVQRGVQAQRVHILGFGESRPVATNTTPVGRQMNRRVEIRINPNAQG
jgi:outer membrane protein OmpA-like peptidoglycan-associated protein